MALCPSRLRRRGVAPSHLNSSRIRKARRMGRNLLVQSSTHPRNLQLGTYGFRGVSIHHRRAPADHAPEIRLGIRAAGACCWRQGLARCAGARDRPIRIILAQETACRHRRVRPDLRRHVCPDLYRGDRRGLRLPCLHPQLAKQRLHLQIVRDRKRGRAESHGLSRVA